MNLKKILAVAMCATVMSATGAMMASADEETINLMPANKEAITANNVDVTYEGGKLIIKGGSVEGTVSWTPNASYDLAEKPFMYISLTTDKGFDGTMDLTADGISRTPGIPGRDSAYSHKYLILRQLPPSPGGYRQTSE